MIKYFKVIVFILCLWPLAAISLNIYFDELGPEPIKKIMHHFGEWTLIFICLTLSMSPLKKITNSFIFLHKGRIVGNKVLTFSELSKYKSFRDYLK